MDWAVKRAQRLIGPLLVLVASGVLLLVARMIWAHHVVPAVNPDHTPQYVSAFMTLAIAAPACLSAMLAIIALYLRLRPERS